jgi:hypothetical protein
VLNPLLVYESKWVRVASSPSRTKPSELRTVAVIIKKSIASIIALETSSYKISFIITVSSPIIVIVPSILDNTSPTSSTS